MHIAIDARELTGQATGAGRYLSQLLTHWNRSPVASRHRYTLYAHRPLTAAFDRLETETIIRPGGGGTRWEQCTMLGALRDSGPDVFFAPAYTAPLLSRLPVVLSVHDVSFAAHPEWFRPREGWRRRFITGGAARHAARVLTLSTFSRDEIVRHLGVRPDRIRVIPLGVGLVEDERRPARANAEKDPVILFVGSIFNRRHVPVLIRSLPAISRRFPAARLVIVGDNRTWPREDLAAEAAAAGVADRVSELQFVTDDQLRSLYASASVFVFLSEYEGFGLTPLEALASGVPAVVLDTPVAREVYGSAAAYVARPTEDIVAETVVRVLESDETRSTLLQEASGVLARYRWSDAAAATLEAIEEAAAS
jgi:glycosyltransferase involved in cell wall biosynthesis